MNKTNDQQSRDSLVTLLRVNSGFINDKGEIYDRDGKFIDFPRELGSKTRGDLDRAAVARHFTNKCVGCFVQERRNYSYYHWTYETLPKLIYLSNNRTTLKVDKLYFHYGFWGHAYQRQALRKLGFSYRQIVDAKRVKSLMAEKIVVIKLNETRLQPSAQLCKTIKSAFIQHPIQKPYRRVYLTREHVKTGRKLLNERELRELLTVYNFQIVKADRLSVTEQAKLFNEAQYIISPHGAALANIVFCEPRSQILELFNQTDMTAWSPLYSTIAQACDLNLSTVAPKQTEKRSKNVHRANFYTDLDAIRAILSTWGL